MLDELEELGRMHRGGEGSHDNVESSAGGQGLEGGEVLHGGEDPQRNQRGSDAARPVEVGSGGGKLDKRRDCY